MKRAAPSDQTYAISSDDSSDSDSDSEDDKKVTKNGEASRLSEEGVLIRMAKMYQEYMNNIPIPTRRGSLIPFTSWQGLAASMKLLYCQPLHYLTNTLLIQWDQARIGSESELQPLDSIVHPVKAEAVIWVTEEVHRLTSSHHHLAKLWASDPMYRARIDSISHST